MKKLTAQEFQDCDFMKFIAKDVAMEHWPRWLASILTDCSREKIYPLVLKECFTI